MCLLVKLAIVKNSVMLKCIQWPNYSNFQLNKHHPNFAFFSVVIRGTFADNIKFYFLADFCGQYNIAVRYWKLNVLQSSIKMLKL